MRETGHCGASLRQIQEEIFSAKWNSYLGHGFAARCEAVALRLCQKSDGNDMAAVWIHKVRTGSGGDRVRFRDAQLLPATTNSNLIGENEGMRRRIDPVATAPGSDFVK